MGNPGHGCMDAACEAGGAVGSCGERRWQRAGGRGQSDPTVACPSTISARLWNMQKVDTPKYYF